MARVTTAEVQAWLDTVKLTIASVETELSAHLETEILARLGSAYDTSGWTTDANTPKLVRTIISKTYASFLIDRFYSEDQEEGNDYAARLMANAEMLITGIIDGSITIPDEGEPDIARGPSYFPTDASSALEPTADNPEYGGPYFSMSKSF